MSRKSDIETAWRVYEHDPDNDGDPASPTAIGRAIEAAYNLGRAAQSEALVKNADGLYGKTQLRTTAKRLRAKVRKIANNTDNKETAK